VGTRHDNRFIFRLDRIFDRKKEIKEQIKELQSGLARQHAKKRS
jgi:hypothetical protein